MEKGGLDKNENKTEQLRDDNLNWQVRVLINAELMFLTICFLDKMSEQLSDAEGKVQKLRG